MVDPKWIDPYGYGKAIAKVARLALIAEENKNETQMNFALQSLYDSLSPWLKGENADKFVYDTTWGGLVAKNGVNSQDADFGNGWCFLLFIIIYYCLLPLLT
jgi:endo-1,3(4)-beta-glucanase